MKKLLMIIVIAIGVSSAAFCQTNIEKMSNGDGSEQAVHNVINDLVKALQTNNVAELGRIWANDYTFVGITGVLATKAERLDALKSGKMKYESISIDNVKIRMYGDAAVATFNGEAKFAPGSKSFNGKFTTTATFIKNNGHWVEVAAESVRAGN